MIFYCLFSLLVIQRLTEMLIAKHNEKWMLKHGGLEIGGKHYPYIVTHHVLFLFSLFLEVIILNRQLSEVWYLLVLLLAAAQWVRYWAIFSLGPYWNTKIIIIPNECVESRGPYQYIRHPNYLVVAIEILFIPLLFGAYYTAIIFSILNVFLMSIRIPTEENALEMYTNYQKSFHFKSRFIPRK